MSTSAYFPKTIEKDPNKFTKTTREVRSQRGTEQVTEYRFLGEPVYPCTEGYCIVKYAAGKLTLSKDIEREVAYYAVEADLPANPRRARGVYRLPGDEPVEAELDTASSGYHFYARHRSVEKVYELLQLVRAGTIRPTEDWDAAQVVGASTATLLDNELARLRRRIGEIGSRQDDLQIEIDRLRRAEADRPRPFLRKLQDRLHKTVQALRTIVGRAVGRVRNAVH